MALVLDQLSKLANLMPATSAGVSRQMWWYESGADTLAAVTTAGYFNGARKLFNVGDRIQLVATGQADFRVLIVTAVPAAGNVTTSTLTSGA